MSGRSVVVHLCCQRVACQLAAGQRPTAVTPTQFSPCRHGRPGIPHMPHVIRQIGTKKIALPMRGLGAHHLQPASATTPDGVLSDLLCAVQAVVCLAKRGILQKKRPSRLQLVASYIHSLAPWNTGSDLNLRRKGSVGSCAGLGRLQPAWRPDNQGSQE